MSGQGLISLDPWAYSQFWAAHAPCQTQNQDAVRLMLEQIDLIRRMCASYTELELVTSAKGGLSNGGIVRGLLWCFWPWSMTT